MNIDQIGGVEGFDGPEGPSGPEKGDRFEGPEKPEETGGAGKSEGNSNSEDPGSTVHVSQRPQDAIELPSAEARHVENIRNLPEEGSPLKGQSEERIAEMSQGFKAGDEAPLRAMVEKLLNEGI